MTARSRSSRPKRQKTDPIDKVRASKAGHAYHEAWAARTALELLLPGSSLRAITLEGFDAVDDEALSTGAVEIADLVRYYGGSDIERATKVEVVQFKYSIASKDVAVRAADLASTLSKFAATDDELRALHGDAKMDRDVTYEFATNRPIHPNLRRAIAAIVDGETGVLDNADVATQRSQLAEAMKDYRHLHAALVSRLTLIGHGDSLAEADRAVGTKLVSWSEASDPQSEVRLLRLQALVRSKAGPDNGGDKRIDRVALLNELRIDHESELYPLEDAFPPVSGYVDRAIGGKASRLVLATGLPLVIHGPGGMGKTVLMQRLAAELGDDNALFLFDGFGGGQWHWTTGRHRPERALVQLANLMAGRGLGDLMLPTADSVVALKAFRRRLAQAVATCRQRSADAMVILLLDAIDHAGIAARESNSPSFAHMLLASIASDPIEGVRVIASCRTERLAEATGGGRVRSFAISGFEPDEADRFILQRDPTATPAEIAALKIRSGLNPRCLATLMDDGRPYDLPLSPGAEQSGDILAELLRRRLETVKAVAIERGNSRAELDLLLAAIALLPPPVPTEEMAAACGMAEAQVESFAADLAPLLERTQHGLMFRDEPTEHLIRAEYGTADQVRCGILDALFQRQDRSGYAARALPALLTSLQDIDQLIALAFDPRVPSRSSKVSERGIRLARISAALQLCAKSGRRDDLFRLLLEASIVAAGHERSDRFMYEFPDLAAVSGDAEAIRRLFSTKAGWPGGRHAALALAHLFSGDQEAARRDSARAIDWHNLRNKGQVKTTPKSDKASRRYDQVGFAYVEMIAGNVAQVVEFFGREDREDGFASFADLFDLFERQSLTAAPRRSSIVDELLRVNSRSRAFWTTALLYSDRNDAADRIRVRRLAQADSGSSSRVAILAAAARAVQLGATSDARKILAKASIEPVRLYDFNSYFAADRDADIAVIRAGVTAALAGRAVCLRDIAPLDLFELVKAGARQLSPKAFDRAVAASLTEKPPAHVTTARRRKPKRGRVEHDDAGADKRREIRETLKHRIEPLMAIAQSIADLLRPPPGKPQADILAEGFDTLTHLVETASSYPYRDGKGFHARVGFRAIFAIADSLGLIDTDLADRIVKWLASAPGIYIPQLLSVIDRLSRSPPLHDAALSLAAEAEARILTDTDIDSRISSYGDLARAVWRVSPDEAAAYFRRTLDLTDAIGSDAFDRTNHILELTGHYRGPVLAPSVGHSLGRILELNQGEERKFPWIEHAQSVVPVAGIGTLPLLSRLDDRDAVQLGRTLGPHLTVLSRSGKLEGELAACLFGLAPPFESWTWTIADVAESALTAMPASRAEWLFDLILVELDREDQLTPTAETMSKLDRLAIEHLDPTSPARRRISALHARRARKKASEQPFAESREVGTGYSVDPVEIDRRILAPPAEGQRRSVPNFVMGDMALNVPAGKRLAFIRAVVDVSAASLGQKIWSIEKVVADWKRRSAAIRDALPNIGARLAQRHAADLVSDEIAGDAGWRGLLRDYDCDRATLVEAVVIGLDFQVEEVPGDGWLKLAAKFAPLITPAAFAAALARFLDHSGSTLPDEVGDGPWSELYQPPSTAGELTAGLIWARLGHPVAAMRWRAAQAVRRLADSQRFDVIDLIVAKFDADVAQPFQDAKHPFYPMHARLWLMMALGRVALTYPDEAAGYLSIAEQVCAPTSVPHVVLREAATRLARTLLRSPANEGLSGRIDAVVNSNRSPFPHGKRVGYGRGRYAERPSGHPRDEAMFHVDYDFQKYQVERVCHVFDCGGWEVEDRISHWVRQWDGKQRDMFSGPRSSERYESGWSSGYMPEVDNYGSYLGWHGMMITAGEFLQTRPIVGDDWEGDAWAAFLDDYLPSRPDGLWLADATDLFPLDLPKEAAIPMPAPGKTAKEAENRELLLPMLETVAADRSIWLPVCGHWSLPNDTSVSLKTVLASQADADAIMITMLTQEPFFRWLPDDEDEIQRHFGKSGHSIRAWIDEVKNSEHNLDRHDPYASRTAMSRPRPASWVQEALQLQPVDDVVRLWADRDGPAMRAEAWGASGGRGEHSWDHSGERITIERSRLLALLGATGLTLTGSLSLQRYHRDVEDKRPGDTRSFTHRSLMFVIDHKGRMTLRQRPSRRGMEAFRALSKPNYHPELRELFTAIRRIQS